jgi:hypothetical protein
MRASAEWLLTMKMIAPRGVATILISRESLFDSNFFYSLLSLFFATSRRIGSIIIFVTGHPRIWIFVMRALAGLLCANFLAVAVPAPVD